MGEAAAALDAGAVAAWMATLEVGARAPISFARIGRGASNLTFAASDAAGSRWVLRRPPLGELLASAHDIAREHRILAALQDTAVPVPLVLGFTTDPAVTDAPLLLMEHVDGLVVDSLAVARGLSEPRRGAIGRSLARTLGRVHGVDLDAAGLADLASTKPYAERQLRRWLAQWEASRTRELPLIERLAERLAARVPVQREVALVHGDYHLLNVIVGFGHPEVRAVLDWELCTLGDPLADLGGLLAYWPEMDSVAAPFPASALPGFPRRADIVATYAQETGRDVSAVGFWHALGLWKIAIIAEGVRRRATHGGGEAPAERLVDDLVARAEAVAGEAGL